MIPSKEIRKIYDKRRATKILDEYDMLFGSCSTLEKSIIEHLDGCTVRWYQKFWWFMTDRCTACGGEVWAWDSRKAYCEDCGQKN